MLAIDIISYKIICKHINNLTLRIYLVWSEKEGYMSNMSYCRHENTLRDLQDVIEKWDEFDEEDASPQEIAARKKLENLINWDEA